MNILAEIERLISFALHSGIIAPSDETWARNTLLGLLRQSKPHGEAVPYDGDSAAPILSNILDYCAEAGMIPDNTTTSRDLMDARVMGAIMARPSDVCNQFKALYAISPRTATDWFYALCRAANYIQTERIAKNDHWLAKTAFGDMEITINLSKPEKTGEEIARALNAKQTGYPKCALCAENEGFFGNLSHAARENLRLIPVELTGEEWFFQYSPYLYYNEHCIVLKRTHEPMAVDGRVFRRLFDFVDKFPHYFIGSNAGLPIVGGSILSHDHYQGGRHVFPMEKAAIYKEYTYPPLPYVRVGLVEWPMPVLRVSGVRRWEVEAVGDVILEAWQDYNDEPIGIISQTDARHNAITPIARINADGKYELDIVPRNNRVTAEHPLGLFHPHKELHHIKQENIGLIEVMGLAVLPGRLERETAGIAEILTGRRSPFPKGDLEKHAAWISELTRRHGTANTAGEAVDIIRGDIGRIFTQVLSDAGVFKFTNEGRAHLAAFARACGLEPR